MGFLSKVASTVVGSAVSGLFGNRQANKDRQMQKDFAKHGIQWKVADAKAAGVHPLAALGVPPTTAQPVAVGADPGRPFAELTRYMADAQMQKAVMEGDLSRAKADYFDTLRARESLGYNIDLERHLDAKDDRKSVKNPLGSKSNPLPMFKYYLDPYSGKIVPAPHTDFAEGGEGSIGSKAFYYGFGRESPNIFE